MLRGAPGVTTSSPKRTVPWYLGNRITQVIIHKI